MEDNTLFENAVYQVTLNDDVDGYVVVNKDTGIYELSTDYLPDAIFGAVDGQARLRWYADIAAAMAEKEAEEEEAEDIMEIEVELDDRTIN